MTRTFHHAIKKMLVATGMTIKSAPRSGCSNTKKAGSHTIHKNGINPSDALQRKFLYFVQKAATDKIMESFKNSVGWSEKGIQGISNHQRAPFIFTPTISTRRSITKTLILIIFICFFHHK